MQERLEARAVGSVVWLGPAGGPGAAGVVVCVLCRSTGSFFGCKYGDYHMCMWITLPLLGMWCNNGCC